MKKQSWIWLLAGIVVVSLAVVWAWLRLPVSSQELLANYAKASDFFEAAGHVGGLPWWSPMFLQGTTLATSWSFMVTNLVMMAFSVPLGFLAGPKVAMIFCLSLGAVGSFLFVRRFAQDDRAGWVAAGLFLLNPSVLTRAAEYEHFVVVCSLAFLPWTFLGLLLFFERPSRKTALFSAMTYAAVVLAYGKTGVMALPVLIVFGFVLWMRATPDSRPSKEVLVFGAGAFLLLAVVPNLPALRETRFLAMFEFGPFEGWQQAFSTKSPISWIDRWDALTSGIDPMFAPTTANGGTYLGLLVCATLAMALWRGTLHDSLGGRGARLFLALALGLYWLSFGPRSVLSGQGAFLSMTLSAPDYTPAVAWFLFFVQGWVIFRLIPPDFPFRSVIATGACAVFFLVPGFRLLEWLPIYRNIRAPFDFFQITGAFCLVVATAMLLPGLFQAVRNSTLRTGLITLVACLAVLDVSPYARSFFFPRLDRGTFNDFVAAQDYLKSSTVGGRVYALSGRYFYLLTPTLSGRALANEAFNSYLQQRGAAALQGAAFLSDEFLLAYLRTAGISHVLIDKNDPDTPADLQERFRKILPSAFENKAFVVLENRNALDRAFLARDYLQTDNSEPAIAAAVLGGAHYDMVTIQTIGVSLDDPTYRGRIIQNRIAAREGDALQGGTPFRPLLLGGGNRWETFEFEASPENGWAVFTEAWHPDWRAFANSDPREIHRAMLGFSAVRVSAGETVTFQFAAPWWYDVCAWIGILSWVSALGVLMAGLFVPRHGKEECL